MSNLGLEIWPFRTQSADVFAHMRRPASLKDAARGVVGAAERPVQFPVGLSLDDGGEQLVLSWGFKDKETMLTSMPSASTGKPAGREVRHGHPREPLA